MENPNNFITKYNDMETNMIMQTSGDTRFSFRHIAMGLKNLLCAITLIFSLPVVGQKLPSHLLQNKRINLKKSIVPKINKSKLIHKGIAIKKHLKKSSIHKKQQPNKGTGRAFKSNGNKAILPGLKSGIKNDVLDMKNLGKKELDINSIIEEKKIGDYVQFKGNFDKDLTCKKLPLNKKVNIDFENAELDDLVKLFSCWTEKNFIIAGKLGKGKSLTILAPKQVTVYEAYKVFFTALEINNMTVVPSGKFLKIMDIAKARTSTLPFVENYSKIPNSDRIVTAVIPLENIEAKDIEPILNKYKSQYADITIYQPTNTIFLSENGANLRRLLKLIKMLDVPVGKDKIWIRQIEYANASEIAKLIQDLFGQSGSKKRGYSSNRYKHRYNKYTHNKKSYKSKTTIAGEGGLSSVSVTKIISVERTNQLIIVANKHSYMKIDRLIRKMDVPIEGEGSIHIYYLENAAAEDISGTLSNLVQGKSSSHKYKHKSKYKKSKYGKAASLLEGDVKITADKGTNSLVIQSSLKDYLSLKKIIQMLDIRRKQVYVEAVIMEITTSKDRKFRISGSGGTTYDYKGNVLPLLLGMGGLGISGLDSQQLMKGGMAVGLQGPLLDVSTGNTGDTTSQLTGGTLSVPAFGFLMQAIQSNSDVNVLSTPHILTLDNEEAEIQVGKQIPYRSSSYGGLSNLMGMGSMLGGLGGNSRYSNSSGYGGYGGGYSNPYSMLGMMGGGIGMVQRIDVDLTLKITPQVNESNYVKLKIEENVQDVESVNIDLGPTTSKRKVTNTVVVKDQQPVVIGGLMRDSTSEAIDKIPILGDIPVIGVLFRKTVKMVEKKNLLMIITPYIVNDPSDLKEIHRKKMEEMKKFMDYMSMRGKLPKFKIDYRKKHGVVEEINEVMTKVKKDRQLQEKAMFNQNQTDSIGPPETHDIDYDPLKDNNKPTNKGQKENK